MRWHERLLLSGVAAMVVGVAWFIGAAIGRPDVMGAASVGAFLVGLVLLVAAVYLEQEEEP